MWQFAMNSPGEPRSRHGGNTLNDRRVNQAFTLGCFICVSALHLIVLSAVDFTGLDSVIQTKELSLVFETVDIGPEISAYPVPETVPETPPAPVREPEVVSEPAVLAPQPAVVDTLETVPEAESETGLVSTVQSAPEQTGASSFGEETGAGYAGSGHGGAEQIRQRSMTDAEYMALVMSLLEKNKIYPLAVRRRGIEGNVTVGFTIQKDGRVSGIQLLDPAGHRFLAQAAFETIRSSSPFPVMEDLDGDYLVQVTIRYRLEDNPNSNN
jgi:TonB family protein